MPGARWPARPRRVRALGRSPEVVDALYAELAPARGANAWLDAHLTRLLTMLEDRDEIEFRARSLVDAMALALQAALLVQHAPAAVADAFCASRLAEGGHRQYGTLPRGVDCGAIIDRATPRPD